MSEDVRALLHAAADHAADDLEELDARPVAAERGYGALLDAFEGPLPEEPVPARVVLDELVAAARPGLLATNSPRFHGFVIGGALPAAIAADWMATSWDNPAGLAGPTPAVCACEDVAGRWLIELLGLPAHASFALVTGGQMANFTALAAARHAVLARAGWDVERRGLAGAPPVRVLAGEERHVTIDVALRLLGLGTETLELVEVDERGAMRADALRRVLARGEPDRPVIVCAQAGNVNGGAVDPLRAIGEAARAAAAWLHVDGAFGLWAAASPRRRALVNGAELAHSWATDAHKWLNVPYDCGVAVVSDREAHRAAVGTSASYLVQGDGTGPRDPTDWTPELSRRARGLALYAALRSLGRSGVAELVDRLCACAERAAERLGEDEALEVLGCELNQVVVALRADDAGTDAVVAAVQREGTCWVSPTTWRGRRGIRLSMSNWKTTPADVDRSVAAIRAAAAAMGAGGPEASSRATPR